MCCPLPDRVAPVFVQVVSSPLGGSSLSSFFSYGLQVVTLEVHLSSLRRLIWPTRDHFVFITLLIISALCPLPDSDVGLSILVCDIGHTSAHFGLCGRKFVMCLFGQCQMLQEVQIMEDTLMIPQAPTLNLQTSRKPLLTMCGHTSLLYTQSLDSIRHVHSIRSENKTNIMFVLED